MFEDRMFKQLGLLPHLFASEDGRTAVLRWWDQQQAITLADSAGADRRAP
jgi:hypothetical protein